MNPKIFSFLLVIFACVVSSMGRSERRLCGCNPRGGNPVCGSDRVTYRTDCHLSCQARQDNPNLFKVHDGKCTNLRWKSRYCRCPPFGNKVCGSDGVTYPTDCHFRCTAAENPDLQKKSDGPCPKKRKQNKLCGCNPRGGNPVCGSDRVTYPTDCHLSCEAKQDNPNLFKVHDGKCTRLGNPRLCGCPPFGNQVCGSDGVTYLTDCHFRCTAAENPDLQKKSDGPCPKKRKQNKLCGCNPRGGNPVCGSDRVTYRTDCHLSCEAKQDNPNLFKVHDGKCTRLRNPRLCGCPPFGNQVCGSDGVTYLTDCHFKCAAFENPDLQKKSNGPCPKNRKRKMLCGCPPYGEPVCGSDGVTYLTECHFRCAAHENANLNKVHNGPCYLS